MEFNKIILRAGLAAGGLLVCYSMGQLLVPFALAIILAYAFHIPAKKFEQLFKISPALSSLIIILSFCSACVLFGIFIIPLIKDAALIMLSKLPLVMEKLSEILNSVEVSLGLDNLRITEALRQGALQFSQSLPSHILRFLNTGITLMYILMYAIMTPILTFYLLKDWKRINSYFSFMLRRFCSQDVIEIIHKIHGNLGLYITGQLRVCAVLGFLYTIALWLSDIDDFLVCGIFSGIMTFAPFFGPLISFISTISVSADNLSGLSQILIVGSIYFVIPFIDTNFITPRLIGAKVGMQPFWIIFSICATVSLFGTLGIFISIPMAIILSTICKHLMKNL